jgi:hypothetical protein
MTGSAPACASSAQTRRGKAWDAEGLPAELCVRAPDGIPVALDPSNPAARAAVRESVHAMLGPGGLDADGLKVDFTARTPSGTALSHHGPGWGIALLHDLLEVVYVAAKEAKADALVITHTPHPAFVDVTDMIRLNDMYYATHLDWSGEALDEDDYAALRRTWETWRAVAR